MNLDITEFVTEFLRHLWKIILIPFHLWNKVPLWIRWIVFIMIGILALLMLLDALKKRNAPKKKKKK